MERKKLYIISAVIITILISAIIAFISYFIFKPVININDYITIEESGRTELGTVDIKMDIDKLVQENEKALTKWAIKKEVPDKDVNEAAIELLRNYNPFSIHYIHDHKYKNGDMINANIVCDEKYLKKTKEYFHAKFKYSAFNYEVHELLPLKTIDPFDKNLYIYGFGISGKDGLIAPYITVETKDIDGMPIEFPLKYTVDNQHVYKNGEEIEISVDLSEKELKKIIDYNGIKLSRTHGTAIVNGLAFYPKESPEDVFKYLKNDTIKSVVKDIIKDQDGSAIDITMAGMMFLYNAEDKSELIDLNMNDQNQMVMFYKINHQDNEKDYYIYIAPKENVVIRPYKTEHGTISYNTEIESSDFPKHKSFYKYTNKEEILDENNEPIQNEYKTLGQCFLGFKNNELKEMRYESIIYDKIMKENGFDVR